MCLLLPDLEVVHGLDDQWEASAPWISPNRRLARDFERYATTVAAFIRLAMIRIMLRRLAASRAAARGIVREPIHHRPTHKFDCARSGGQWDDSMEEPVSTTMLAYSMVW
jgi:hypothetical protein